jgi:hypothetical protein
MALTFRSTRNQEGNRDPILITVHLYHILELGFIFFCPFTRTSNRSVDVGIQYGDYGMITFFIGSKQPTVTLHSDIAAI